MSRCKEIEITKKGNVGWRCDAKWRVNHPFGRKSKSRTINDYDHRTSHKMSKEEKRRFFKMIEFMVYGNPVAKGRPRFSRRNGFVATYTPPQE